MEYIGNLQRKSKWLIAADTLHTGAVVLLKDENTPPLKLKLGNIV